MKVSDEFYRSVRKLNRALVALGWVMSVCTQGVAASPAHETAHWRRWLEPAPAVYAVSVAALGGSPAFESLERTDPTESLLGWTEHMLMLIQKYQQNPQRAARSLAIVHAAMHDAFVSAAMESIERSGIIAAHRAAGLTLAFLYPYESTSWIEGRGVVLAHAVAGGLGIPAAERDLALAIGARVAGDAMHRALVDGADRRLPKPRAVASVPGRWRATPPLNIHTPQEPLAGEWMTWMAGTRRFHPPAPPEYGSGRFLEEAQEVYRVASTLTSEQKRIAETWNLQQGSVTPPGVWNQRTLELLRSERLDPAAAARVLAAVNVAMHDAAIACWAAKYQWWVVRPVTVIREKWDPAFLPHLVTPPHPSYVSGHSSVSGAAEVVLGAFFPARKAALHGFAEEAALSRLYGGIHYRSDNEEGLRLGRRVGMLAVEKVLGGAAYREDGATPKIGSPLKEPQ